MKKKWEIVILLLLCGMISGCGKREGDAPDAEEPKAILEEKQDAGELASDRMEAGEQQREADMQQKEMQQGEMQDGLEAGQEENAGENKIELLQAQKAEIVKKENREGRELTDAELQTFSKFIRRQDNYGFLMSVYDTPADVDLDEIFYCGAGIDGEQATEEEAAAYLYACGWEEIYTDFEKLTTAQIDTFLQEKTGFSYEQMNSRLKWTYLPEYDAYYSEHGDTNYSMFTCVEGYTVDEQTFTLRCRPCDFGDPEPDGYHIIDYELVLKKYGEEYQFASNRLMWENGLIEEQSFQVVLAPLGEVVFASYAPDLDADPLADVSFSIIKNGKEIRRLMGVFWENIRINETFNEVEAVAFADYNQDGNADIIMIISYSPVSGPEAGISYSEVRLYEGRNEYLYYDEEMSGAVNMGTAEKTIRTVIDFIAENG